MCKVNRWLGRGQERLGRWHFFEENPYENWQGLDGLLFQNVSTLKADFFFLGGGFGGFSTTRMEEGAKYCDEWIFKTWWTWQIYSCMTDLEGDVLIHIGYINLYEWFCYICTVCAYLSPKPWPDGTWIELRNRILGYLKFRNYNSNSTEAGSVFWRDTTTRASLVDLNITSSAFSWHQITTKNLTFLVSNMFFPHWTMFLSHEKNSTQSCSTG